MKLEKPTAIPTEQLINALQSYGVRLVDPKAGTESRRGGAGPSDHKAITVDGMTVMVPVHTAPAFESPYWVDKPDAFGRSRLSREGATLGEVSFPALMICAPPTAFLIRTSPHFMVATSWRPQCCRPASVIRVAPRPASSARSASRWRRGARSNARARRSLPKSRPRRSHWTA